MRFSDEDGKIDISEMSDYVKKILPKEEKWNEYMVNMLHHGKSARFLAKIKIDFDTGNSRALFNLPDFSFPKKKSDAVADWNVVDKNRKYLLSSAETWGIVEINCHEDTKTKKILFFL